MILGNPFDRKTIFILHDVETIDNTLLELYEIVFPLKLRVERRTITVCKIYGTD